MTNRCKELPTARTVKGLAGRTSLGSHGVARSRLRADIAGTSRVLFRSARATHLFMCLRGSVLGFPKRATA
jgi:hypothetical protein